MTLADYFLAKAPEMGVLWHGERNGGLTPAEVSPGSHRKVWWRCEKGHQWEAVIGSVVQDGCGCPYCAGKRAIPGETDLATLRPDLLEQWDYGKNTGTDPAAILPSTHQKVWWRCSLGHSWQAMVFSRTTGRPSGCPYCTGKRVLTGFNDLGTLKPKLAEQWHPTLNGGLGPEAVSPGSNKKVWWRCGAGHVWQAAVYSRTRSKSAGCPVCAGTVKRSLLPPQK